MVVLSNDDPYVDLNENRALFKKNLKAVVIVEQGKGHFTVEDGIQEVPEVIEQLNSFA